MKLTQLTGGVLALLVVLLYSVAPVSAQGFKWWQDEGYKRELGLTVEQTTRLEEVFQKSSPSLRKHKDALDRAEAEFDRLVERGDDTTVMDHVSVVETARAELNKARVMMLLRMRRSLTADQWAKFTALHERDSTRSESGGRRK